MTALEGFRNYMLQQCDLHPLTSWWKIFYLIPLINLIVWGFVVYFTPNSFHNSQDGKKDWMRVGIFTLITHFYSIWVLMSLFVQPICHFTCMASPQSCVL